MVPAHAASAPAVAGASGLTAIVWIVALTVPAIALAMALWRRFRRSFRVCPLCSAVAVRAVVANETAPNRLRIRLQCGQCGVWRCASGRNADLERHKRAVRRDRRGIADQALRLAARRKRHGRDEFVRELRSRVVGADDFVARARRPTSRVHRSGAA